MDFFIFTQISALCHPYPALTTHICTSPIADMDGEGRIWVTEGGYEGECEKFHVIIYLSHTYLFDVVVNQ